MWGEGRLGWENGVSEEEGFSNYTFSGCSHGKNSYSEDNV